MCYLNGKGVAKDEVEADAPFNIAAINTSMAAAAREKLEKQISPDQRSVGQRRTTEIQKEIEAAQAKNAGKYNAPVIRLAAACFLRFRSKDMLFLVFRGNLDPAFDFGSGRFTGREDTFTPLTVTTRDAHRSRCSPARAGWWARLCAALVFAFYLNYLPAHLASETHLHDSVASIAEADPHHHDHDDGDHHHDSDHHTPHRASDHTLTLTTASKAPRVPALVVFILPSPTSVIVSEPEPQPPVPVFERIRPPGESPPDPRQPRAPPLA